MTFGERVKTLRTEQGFSQEELAKLTGISARVIGYYEAGERFPHSEEALLKLSEVFGVSLDYLLDNPLRNENFCPSRFCYMKSMSAEDRASVNQFVHYLRSLRQEKDEAAGLVQNESTGSAKKGKTFLPGENADAEWLDNDLRALIQKCAPKK